MKHLILFTTALVFTNFSLAGSEEPENIARVACRKVDSSGKPEKGLIVLTHLPTYQTFGTKRTVLSGEEFIDEDTKRPFPLKADFTVQYYDIQLGKADLSKEKINEIVSQGDKEDYSIGLMKRTSKQYLFSQGTDFIKVKFFDGSLDNVLVNWNDTQKGGAYSCIMDTVDNPAYNTNNRKPDVLGSVAGGKDQPRNNQNGHLSNL